MNSLKYYDNEDLWIAFDKATNEWLDERTETQDGVRYDSNQARELAKKLVRQEKDEAHVFSSHFLVVYSKNMRLQKLVEYRQVDAAINAVDSLWNVLGNAYNFPLENETIKNLLDIGARIVPVHKPMTDRNIEYMVMSARRLSEKFSGIKVSKGTFEFGEDFSKKIFLELDQKMAQLGGKEFLAHYDRRSWLIQRYVPELDRYMLFRQNPMDERGYPIQFLLQLAGRHLTDIPVRKWEYQEKLHKEIIELASDFLEICDVQGNNGISYSMMDPKDINREVLNDLFYQKMCIPFQYSAKFILNSLNHLIYPWFDKAGRKYRYRDYYALTKFFLQKNWWEMKKRYFTLEEIHHETGIAKYKLKELLDDVSKPASEINNEFTSFDGKTNFFEYPLVYFPRYGYLCFDWHFSGIGFVTRIHSIIKKRYQNLDVEQGPKLEEWLRDEMRRKGYNVKFGHYPEKGGRNEGECDFVLENKKLCFLELKKRAVIHDFDELDDVGVWGAIGQGLLNAQKQCFSHELYLMSNGLIEFDNGDSVVKNLDAFPVVKVSVCYGEHSYICSKAYVSAMMRLVFNGGEIVTRDAERQSKVEKFNEYANNMREIVNEENQLLGEKIDLRKIITHSVFCSVQQILCGLYGILREKTIFLVY